MLIYRQNHAARGTPRQFVRHDEDVLTSAAPIPLFEPLRGAHLPRAARSRDGGYRAPILLEVERWLKCHDLSATQFGAAAVGDPGLVADLRGGRDPSSRMVARIRAFMEREA